MPELPKGDLVHEIWGSKEKNRGTIELTHCNELHNCNELHILAEDTEDEPVRKHVSAHSTELKRISTTRNGLSTHC